MWGGVTKGLAGIKLSGSPSLYGAKRVKSAKIIIIKIKPKISLNEK
jgi:hypothetical protein